MSEKISQLPALAAVPQAAMFPVVVPGATVPPSGPGGSNEVVTYGQVGAAASADFGRVFIGGHSYASGYLTTENGGRWAFRLAAALKAEEVTYAVTDAALALDDSAGHSGGFADMLHALMPRATGASSYTARTAQPYLPMSPLNVFYYGINDLTYLSATVATNVAWFKMALRACVCMARAGGWFADTHGSVAYSAGWTANTTQDVWGTATSHSTTTVTTTTVTITVPADFPGGEIDLLTLAKGGASGGGTKWSTVVDGGTAQVLDGTGSAFGAASGRTNAVVQRLTGLAAGAHTIVMTVAALDSTATAVFCGWMVKAPAPGLTVLCNQPAVPGLPLTTTGAHTPITAADVTSLNAAITALAAEFTDGLVVVADVASYFASAGGNVVYTSPNSLYVSDNLHPNSAGHALIARCILDTVRSAPLTGTARFAPAGIFMRQVGAPLEPAMAGNWSVYPAGVAWFGKDRGGRSYLNMQVVRSGGAPALGETMMTLPPGYQPGTGWLASCGYWTTGFAATAGDGLVGVNANQTLSWYHGEADTMLLVCASWLADGLGA